MDDFNTLQIKLELKKGARNLKDIEVRVIEDSKRWSVQAA
jgi:hypothetical protein